MNPTPADYEKLARTLCESRGDDPDAMEKTMKSEVPAWQMEGINSESACVSTTRDTLDDFRRNSRGWQEPGRLEEISGGLYWAECQAIKGHRRCELCIVDCGGFRLIYQC